MSIWKALCCCNGQEDEDSDHLVPRQDEAERGLIRDTRSNGSMTNHFEDGSDVSQLTSAPKTREQVEEELLNKILERTQQRVIEVSNYEIYNGDVDVAERSAKYQTAITRHDENKSLHISPSLLLSDSGLDITEVAQRPGLIGNDLEVLLTWNKSCISSVKMGLQIEKKDDIVVYMKSDE
ncbi:hypothetical protein FO519_008659 [Halicephalobus sp. NKZ332]|nr:hypothetical protein FO519_008659 [Halicephalobus sp. NKZ332]